MTRAAGLLMAAFVPCCAGLSLVDSAPLRGAPSVSEQLNREFSKGESRISVVGDVKDIVATLDAFLTPRLEWRVGGCRDLGQSAKCSLVRVPNVLLDMFRELDRAQFPASLKDHGCKATVSVSGQNIGATTQMDLYHGFEVWLQKRDTAFVPVWTRADQAAVDYEYLVQPFCQTSTSPTHLQDCYFLPVSSCEMGAEQWDSIRHRAKQFGEGNDMTLYSHQRRQKVKFGDEVDARALWQMMFFRQNMRTSIEIAWREKVWREQNTAWPDTAEGGGSERRLCAAIHVRHGDKLTKYWMKVHDTIRGGFNRTFDDYLDEALVLLKEQAALESGATLESRPLVFVISDDLDVIQAARRSKRASAFTVDPGMPLRSLKEVQNAEAEGHQELADAFQYGKATSEDMLSWLLSLRLMSACDTFVGNLDSTFTKFVYYGMCEQRNGRCPRATTLGTYLPDPKSAMSINVSFPVVVKKADR